MDSLHKKLIDFQLTIMITPLHNQMKIFFRMYDKNANPQITEKLFIKSSYVFTINCMNKKNDQIISAALRDTKALDSYFSKFNHFSLTFNFLTPKERELCYAQNKLTHTLVTNSYNTNTQLIHHHETHTINFKSLAPYTLHHSS